MKTIAEHGTGPFKGRGSLYNIAEELKRQRDARNDFVIDTNDLRFGLNEAGDPRLFASNSSAADFIPRAGYPLLDQAFTQLCQKAHPGGIPTKFARRAWEHNRRRFSDYITNLLYDNPKRRLVRVLDGKVRAFLGQNYKAIGSLEIATFALQQAEEHNALPIEASITDQHMRLRFVSREVVEKLERVRNESQHGWFAGGLGSKDALRKVAAQHWGDLPGDQAHPAISFRNSETGHGGADADGGLLLACCFNLAWVVRGVHEVHIGEKLEEGVFTEATIRKHADLVQAKIRDFTKAHFDKERFAELMAKTNNANEHQIKAPSVALRVAIESSAALADDDLDQLLNYVSEQPGKATAFNIGQAISRFAQDQTPDGGEELEWLAGQICSGGMKREFAKAEDGYFAALEKRYG